MRRIHERVGWTGSPRSRWTPLVAASTLLLLACLTTSGQVVMNEIMADNKSAVIAGTGEYPDYVELYNSSAQAVNLAGMSLTDDATKPRKYVFPAGTSIAGRGYRMVWCTTNRVGAGLRSGFGLNADGDELRLYGTNGSTILDRVTFGLQAPNFSIGRIPVGNGDWVLNEPTPLATNEVQGLAPPTRLCFNEWMAKVTTGNDWLELYNATNLPTRLSGLVITDRPSGVPTNRPIPALSFVGPHGFVKFLASDLEKTDADHLDFKLSASGEVLSLYHSNKMTIIDRVSFGAQTDDISQGRLPDGSDNVVFFAAGYTTPDEPNQAAITSVVISEVLSHTDPPLEDAVELHNVTDTSVNISYWWLSDSAEQRKKFRIPAGTTLPPRGFKVFYQCQLEAGSIPFTFDSSEGDQVYLSAGNAAGGLTGPQTFVEFGALKNGVSCGRHQTTAGVDMVPMHQRSFGVDNPATVVQFRTGAGRSNGPPRVGPVVISEIHYYPADIEGQNNADDEFIELHNASDEVAHLFDLDYPTNRWRVREGVTFNVPAAVSLAARGYLLLVPFDPIQNTAQLAAFRTKYSVPAGVAVYGPYSGKLSDIGEAIRLLWPDEPQPPDKPNAGFVPYEQVERIQYSSASPWPERAAGTGYSLQRLVMLGYGNEPTNWCAAPPTAGRATVADTDGDGMPDDWEILHGLDPRLGSDGTLDPDGDWLSNYAECQAGTDPHDRGSALRIRSLQIDGGTLRLEFEAVSGRSYGLQGCSDLARANWEVQTNIPPPAVSGAVTVSLPHSPSHHQFIRVVTPAFP